MKGEFEWRPNGELKDLASLPRVIPEPEPPKALPARATPADYLYDEPVVNSERIKWKPIDKVAARVVAKCPWQYQPPVPEPKFLSTTNMSTGSLNKDSTFGVPGAKEGGSGRIRTRMGLTEEGHVEELVNIRDCAYPALEEKEKRAKEAVQRTEELHKRAQETWDTIDYLLGHVEEPTLKYLDFVKGAITQARDQRMALQTETRGLMNALREVREFFLEDKHAEEVKRLTEFVELCERLQKLKDSGFLDAVTETMLRL